MTLGPLEYTVIGFEGNNFDGSIAREIAKVVENGTIALVDVVFIGRDGAGNPVILELDNKDDPRFAGFQNLVAGRMGLFTPEDLMEIAETLPDGASGLILLFEHRWAVAIKEAMADFGRLPRCAHGHSARGCGRSQRRARRPSNTRLIRQARKG